MKLNIVGKMPGPMDNSTNHYVKLSFKEGLEPGFIIQITNALAAKEWERSPGFKPEESARVQSNPENSKVVTPIKTRRGIIGIERSLQEKQRATDDSISMAFQDLKKLMGMAKDMVTISKTISAKIRVSLGH